MKRLCIVFLCAVIAAACFPVSALADVPALDTPYALLLDAESGDVLYDKDADIPVPVASVTKIMTVLLCLEAYDAGSLSMDETISVSRTAAGMGGSQAFLEAGGEYRVYDLMKSICVASANDASVAMAERISGSQEAFVSRMNERAAELGMNGTVFRNCTGLPESGHVCSARDVAIMARELIRHDIFFEWSRIWLDEIEHPGGRKTVLTNTNRLIRFYDGCDGIKTGSTSEAKYCLAATAVRGGMRLIAVVLAAPTTDTRFADARTLLDYGFANYMSLQLVNKGELAAGGVPVGRAVKKETDLFAEDGFSVTVKRGEEGEYSVRTEIFDDLRAPVEKGDRAGRLVIMRGDEEIGSVPVVTGEDIPEAGLFDYVRDIAGWWIN